MPCSGLSLGQSICPRDRALENRSDRPTLRFQSLKLCQLLLTSIVLELYGLRSNSTHTTEFVKTSLKTITRHLMWTNFSLFIHWRSLLRKSGLLNGNDKLLQDSGRSYCSCQHDADRKLYYDYSLMSRMLVYGSDDRLNVHADDKQSVF